jgi:hypothetical protein
MEVGQLFFSLGFKSTGTASAEQFESVTAQLAETSTKLIHIFEQIGNTLEKVAIKMNATTKEEIELFKANQKADQSIVKLGESLSELEQEQQKQAAASKKGRSLYQMFVQGLDDSVGKMNRIRIQIVGVATAMTILSKKSSEYAASLVRFNQLTGLNTQALQRLQRQAAASGLEADEVSGALQELQETSVNIAMGKGGSDAWQLLGIKPGLDPFQQLEQLKKAMGNMSTPFFTKLAKEAGLSESFIGFLRDMKDLPAPEENLILSEDEIAELKSFNIAMNKALDGFQVALKKVGALLLPITKQIIYMVDRWGWAIRSLIDGFNKLGSGVKSVMKIIGVVALGIAAYFFPITAALTAIILLVDDFITFMQGGDSIIGRVINYLTGGFELVKKVVGDVFDFIDEKITKFGFLKDIGEFFQKLNPFALKMFGESDKGGSDSKFVPYGQNFAQGGAQTVNNNITISVPGVSDPEAFAKQVSDALKRQNTDGYFQNGNTGR